MALTERLAAATAEARRALVEAIGQVIETDLDPLRVEMQTAFREAKAAETHSAECMTVIRNRIPYGRKLDLPSTLPEVSEQTWLYQQALDAKRHALSREDAVEAFQAATLAVAEAAATHARYVEVAQRWDAAVGQLTGAVMAAAAPWVAEAPPSGLAVLIRKDTSRPRGCAVDGRKYVAADKIPAPLTAENRQVIAHHSTYFLETWTAPPPKPEPTPPPEPTPWDDDARPAAATVDPAVLRAVAMGATVVS